MTILWQNGTGDPKRVGPDDWTKDEDFTEIVEQINRRRRLEYRPEDGALDDPFDPALWMRAPSVTALRYEFTGNDLIHPPVGGLGGQPPIRQDLGCVGPVIAQQIEEAMLGKRIKMDTRDAEAKAANVRRFIAAERRLRERVARLHERLLEARDGFHLTPDRVARATSVALEIAGKPPLEPASLSGTPDAPAFTVPLLTGTWAQAAHGLEHPHTGARRPITFDHAVAQGRDDVVLAHLHHRLVQMSLRLLRAEVWAHEDRKKLERVAVRSVPRAFSEELVVIVWSRSS